MVIHQPNQSNEHIAASLGDSPVALAWIQATPAVLRRTNRNRWLTVLFVIVLVTVCHWATPPVSGWVHALHILLRKLFIVPILLGAIWFRIRGAVISAAIVSIVYAPYILIAWTGRIAENLNQSGEIVTFWAVGLLAGSLVARERNALGRAADASRDTLRALVAALDAREHQTEQHSLRVANLSLRIGQKLGLGKCDLATLHEAALLHDVGKIGVPDDILLKPGPLSDEERRIMQRHAEMGHAILSSTKHLQTVADLVHAHHERFDGTGYPRGLARDAIPMGARIFTVADVFDALTSDRPYRRAMPEVEAQALIIAESGAHFDPRVVTAFVAVLSESGPETPEREMPLNETEASPPNCLSAVSPESTR